MPTPQANQERVSAALADIPATGDTVEVMRGAARLAAESGDDVRSIHILRSLLAEPSGLAQAALDSSGADLAALRASVGDAPAHATEPGPGSDVRAVAVHAMREAQLLGHHRVDPVHLLVALLYTDTPETSRPLQSAGLSLVELRQLIQSPSAGARGLRRRPAPRMRGRVGVSPVFLGLLALTAAAGAVLWIIPADAVFSGGQGRIPIVAAALVFVLGAWIASVCVHEFMHAFTAYVGGDSGVVGAGYLDLNPLRYTHPFLSLAMPVLFILIGGFGFPGGAVYIDRHMLRTKRWETMVALAGPAGTLVSGVAASVPFWFVGHDPLGLLAHPAFYGALALLVFLEGTGLILNLIPIPGLDGYNAIAPYLPVEIRDLGNRIAGWGMFILFFLLWQGGGLVGWLFSGALQMSGLLGVPEAMIAVGRSLIP